MRQRDDENDDFGGGGGVPADEFIDCYTNYGFIEIENPDDPEGPPLEKDFEWKTPVPLSQRELERRLAEEAERWKIALKESDAVRFRDAEWRIVGQGVSFGC